MDVNFNNIPPELRKDKHFCCWRAIPAKDNPAKINKTPWRVDGLGKLAWSNPADLISFEGAKSLYLAGLDLPAHKGQHFSGIGYILNRSGDLVCIDLDGSITENGEIRPEAKAILERFKSYTEKSPSGRGLHIWIKARIDGPNIQQIDLDGQAVEVFVRSHHVTLTGEVLPGYEALESRQVETEALYFKLQTLQKPKGRDAPPKRAEGNQDQTRIVRYVGKALEYEADAVRSESEGNRNNRLNEAAFSIGRYVGGGHISEGEVERALLRAARASGLPDEEARATIQSGLRAGMDNPKNPEFEDLPESPEATSGEQHKEEGPKTNETLGDDLDPCDIYEILKVFKKWLHIEEDYNIIAPTCAAIANFCPGDPDIIGLIQPSGSIKTEFIRSLGQSENQYAYPLSSLTEHTLVSGHKDSIDLVPLLKGRMICIKDFTTLLSKKEDIRAQIFADFRELTDGYIRKEFGNGIKKEYQDIHSSILFASTNAIERYYSMYSNLGQRLIFLRPRNDPKAARKRSFQNRGKQEAMRDELHQAMMRSLATYIPKAKEGLPQTPDETLEEMGEFYDFLAIVRTPIHHDYRTGEIDELPEPEFPTRIANTIGRLVEVHALLYGRDEVGQKDIEFGLRVVLDNIPTMRWRILECLSTEWNSTSIIAKQADLSVGAIRYVLDELFSLKLVERLAREEKDTTMDRRSDSFKLSARWLVVVEKLKTRIIEEDTLKDQLNQIIDKQNTVGSNPCLQSPGEDDTKTGLGPNPRKDAPTPEKHICYLARVRGAAIAEFGLNGWVDPAKVAAKVSLLECQTMRSLEHIGYTSYERAGRWHRL